MTTNQPILAVSDLDKTFTMHLQGGQGLAVIRGLSFDLHASECVVLGGASGSGKSSILKMVYGNYAVDRGKVLLRAGGIDIDIATADPREILAARRHAMGYVSQFLRCVPRVPALEVVAEPLIERGADPMDAEERAASLLSRLGIPERLWGLPPATFSGGEQQRVNIARGFIADLPMLLLDEPTASLDARNRRVVVELIAEKIEAGTAMLGIFHDAEVREAVADRVIPVEDFTPMVRAMA
ncbi:phosphonate C-P lyase system protein PhnL [Arthrobacter sp. M4]|uniref:phosphonate C-P lyase system protein PhnL n=1 Tax=Arthrobacter sp. M4 TaxID=218160 RepID=UPI001CDB8077|nr:phosphonate C-P lyase system protein PhnL [Arthrobacter sp. M4]MCA4132576.1 phosphonate C-P lyase system protein PhnL [Arthrobacter sp. M4]